MAIKRMSERRVQPAQRREATTWPSWIERRAPAGPERRAAAGTARGQLAGPAQGGGRAVERSALAGEPALERRALLREVHY